MALVPPSWSGVIVQFGKHADMKRARDHEYLGLPVSLESEKRLFVSVPANNPKVIDQGRLEFLLAALVEDYAADVLEDYQYSAERVGQWEEMFPGVDPSALPSTADVNSLYDVLRAIDIEPAWTKNRGEGATIAIVDSGIDGSLPDFQGSRRVGGWASGRSDPWTDSRGHGTMCASIAAGSRELGGSADGVAPRAGIISCKTSYRESELSLIYDYLTSQVRDGLHGLVVSNSFGIPTGSPPTKPTAPPFLSALRDAVAAGMVVVFSAGNYHIVAGGQKDECDPNTIWTYKSLAGVLTVGAARPDGTIWDYSSRGPGQWAGQAETAPKPDVVGVVPPDARIRVGKVERVFAKGWGTSGAAPQVAGLAAILLSHRPGSTSAAVRTAIQSGAVNLGLNPTCQGSGRISASRALSLL